MEKNADAFRTISEVATELDVPQHVLRFWEGKFPLVKPLKRGGGRRYYRPQDVELLRGIKRLLYAEGFTIRGVQRILKEKGARAVCATSRERPWATPSNVALREPSDVAELDLPSDPPGDLPSDPSGDLPSAPLSDLPDSTENPGAPILAAGVLDQTADVAAAADPRSTEASPVAPPRLHLDAADVERLREILAELEHCAEILAAARRA
jgi:DNA-binding transcriptional MerR regulator